MPGILSASRGFTQDVRERVRPTGHWVEVLARAGYTAKGLVYGLLGVLTLQAALGSRGTPEGSETAVRTIGDQPFGRVLLGLTAVGLAGYVLWRFVQAIKDPDNRGSDVGGYFIRAGYIISGLAYAALTVTTASLALGWGGGGSGDASKQEWTAWVLGFPLGQWLVGAVGLTVAGVGIAHFVRAWTARFMWDYDLTDMEPRVREWAKRAGQFGLTARGVTFVIIGWFLVRAAVRSNAGEVRGLGGALQELAAQTEGQWLLAGTAAGLIAYGIYCLTRARYRYFRVQF